MMCTPNSLPNALYTTRSNPTDTEEWYLDGSGIGFLLVVLLLLLLLILKLLQPYELIMAPKVFAGWCGVYYNVLKTEYKIQTVGKAK